ncbi:hypothetical protein LEP1GSC137_0820 [Leptospira borgpetersenii str. Noumea 25]|nr:hypothetical protein LEP1GSC137_0820 [Leptospira borgpetersenii str. Noumea 25]
MNHGSIPVGTIKGKSNRLREMYFFFREKRMWELIQFKIFL